MEHSPPVEFHLFVGPCFQIEPGKPY